MVIVKTASGTTYEFNDDMTEFRRDDVAPFNGIKEGGFGTAWHKLTWAADPVVGEGMLLPIENGYMVHSTAVVSIGREDE